MADFKVFCLEGQWFDDDLEAPATLRGVLELLKSWGRIDYIYRDVSTVAEFERYAARWASEYAQYKMAYFASHGDAGQVWLSDDASVPLERLGDLLEGRCAGRLIHLGGCSTLSIRPAAIRDFLTATGARAVCGYTTDVDTIEAAALEMLLMHELACKTKLGNALNALEDHRYYPGLRNALGFEIWTPGGR